MSFLDSGQNHAKGHPVLKGIGGMALKVSGVFGKVTSTPCSCSSLLRFTWALQDKWKWHFREECSPESSSVD